MVRIYLYWGCEIPTVDDMSRDMRTDAEAVDDFRRVLADSVQQRLVVDVEVASYQRISVEGGLQRIASVVVMQEKFGMS